MSSAEGAAEPVRSDVSALLRAWSGGDQLALAQLTHLSTITVMREWKSAKAWLYRELTG
jgi:hypothetical protein